MSYLLRQRSRIKLILDTSAVFHGIVFLSIGFLPVLHHCNGPGSTFSSSDAAVPLVPCNKDMNFLISSPLPKTPQGGMASMYHVKMSRSVACRGQIYSPSQTACFTPSNLRGTVFSSGKGGPEDAIKQTQTCQSPQL